MNEYLVSKIINLYVTYMDVAVRRPDEGREQERKLCELSNSGTITCVSRLDLDHFERNLIRPDLIRGSLTEIG